MTHKNLLHMKSSKEICLELGIGLILFIAGIIIRDFSVLISKFIFVIGYLVAGQLVLLKTVENVLKGRLIDENVFITLASLITFALGLHAQALGLVLIFQFGYLFRFIMAENTRFSLLNKVNFMPTQVRLVQGVLEKNLPLESVEIGDIIRVAPGEVIPLDGQVMEKREEKLWQSEQEVSSGVLNPDNSLYLKVTTTWEVSSGYQKYALLTEKFENSNFPFSKSDKNFKTLSIIGLAIALATALVLSILGRDGTYWIYAGITFLIVSSYSNLLSCLKISDWHYLSNDLRPGVDSIEKIMSLGSPWAAGKSLRRNQVMTVLTFLPKVGIFVLGFLGLANIWLAISLETFMGLICLMIILITDKK